MVRSQRGGKVKNIKNLMIDLLEDVTHVGTNDIGAGKSVNDIQQELRNLIILTKPQGIVPIISLLTKRTDNFAGKVEHMNNLIVELCNELEVGYIEHDNINATHLNTGGGLHINNSYTSIFGDNFVNYFNFLVTNNFCLS